MSDAEFNKKIKLKENATKDFSFLFSNILSFLKTLCSDFEVFVTSFLCLVIYTVFPHPVLSIFVFIVDLNMGQSVSGLKQEDIEAMMKATNCLFFLSFSHKHTRSFCYL